MCPSKELKEHKKTSKNTKNCSDPSPCAPTSVGHGCSKLTQFCAGQPCGVGISHRLHGASLSLLTASPVRRVYAPTMGHSNYILISRNSTLISQNGYKQGQFFVAETNPSLQLYLLRPGISDRSGIAFGNTTLHLNQANGQANRRKATKSTGLCQEPNDESETVFNSIFEKHHMSGGLNF